MSKALTEIEKKKVTAIGTVFIGIIAKNMGYADTSKVVAAGKECFEFTGKLTYKQFRDIKKMSNEQRKKF